MDEEVYEVGEHVNANDLPAGRIRLRSPKTADELKATGLYHELPCGCLGIVFCNQNQCCDSGKNCLEPFDHPQKGYWTFGGHYFCPIHKDDWEERGAYYSGVFFLHDTGRLDTETPYFGETFRTDPRPNMKSDTYVQQLRRQRGARGG